MSGRYGWVLESIAVTLSLLSLQYQYSGVEQAETRAPETCRGNQVYMCIVNNIITAVCLCTCVCNVCDVLSCVLSIPFSQATHNYRVINDTLEEIQAKLGDARVRFNNTVVRYCTEYVQVKVLCVEVL